MSRREELEEVKAILTLALDALDEVGRLRAEVSMAHIRVSALLDAHQDPDKTPIRPPSSAALEAYRTSESFSHERAPEKPPLPRRPR